MKLRPAALDVAIVAALAAATAGTNGWYLVDLYDVSGKDGYAGAPPHLWWVMAALGLAGMLWRGRYPIAALCGSVLMTLIHLTATSNLMTPLTPLLAAAPIAMYSVAAAPGRRVVSYAALAATVATLGLPRFLDYPPPVDTWRGSWLLPPAAVAAAWLLGDHNRTRQAFLSQARQRADDLERERDQHARLVAAAERARIARELHDVVAHSLSVIVLQAHAGAAELDQRSHPTHKALVTIAATGRESLAEMRRLLGLTRPESSGDAELAPLPSLADLPALVERIRAAGLPVSLSLTGDGGALPASVQLSAYRIAQEALTNALRHAGPDATASVIVRCGRSDVDVTVADTGRGAGGEHETGNGMRGMHERVSALGGTLTAGDRADGGFQVHARLPVQAGLV